MGDRRTYHHAFVLICMWSSPALARTPAVNPPECNFTAPKKGAGRVTPTKFERVVSYPVATGGELVVCYGGDSTVGFRREGRPTQWISDLNLEIGDAIGQMQTGQFIIWNESNPYRISFAWINCTGEGCTVSKTFCSSAPRLRSSISLKDIAASQRNSPGVPGGRLALRLREDMIRWGDAEAIRYRQAHRDCEHDDSCEAGFDWAWSDNYLPNFDRYRTCAASSAADDALVARPRIVPEKVTASSTLPPDPKGTYDVTNLFDLNLANAWSEGVHGWGPGSYIDMEFARPTTIDFMLVANGYQRAITSFMDNGRVARESVIVETVAKEAAKDAKGPGSCSLPTEEGSLGFDGGRSSGRSPCFDDLPPVNRLRLLIDRAVPGRRYENTLISEILIFGKSKFKENMRWIIDQTHAPK